MKNLLRLIMTVVFLATLAAQERPSPDSGSLVVDVGTQVRVADGTKPAGFERYRTAPSGPVLRTFVLHGLTDASPWQLRVRGWNLLQPGLRVAATAELPGKTRFDL